MIARSRAILPLRRISRPVKPQRVRNSSTESTSSQSSATTNPPKPSAADQHKALIAARIQAREAAAAEALAASRADAARQHAALVERTRKLNTDSGSDRYIYITAIVGLLLTPPIIYFWWQHRAEHMGKKKEEMLAELAVRRREFQESRGK